MAIRLWVEGRLALEDGRVRLRGAEADDASLLLQASGACT
jgi:Fe-S cluster biogenesis protein NfuA